MSKLNDLIKQVEPTKRPIASSLVAEISFMRGQLTRLKKEIRAKGCTEHFVQGKQEMDRLTPAFQAYATLVTKYSQCHKQLTALLPEGEPEQGDELDAFIRELRG